MGMVFKIQRYCIHDGPGIRTTVFLKGCSLNCLWCHNPESKNFYPEILYYQRKCQNCGLCTTLCPFHCHRIEEDKHIFHAENCEYCWMCSSGCPYEALEKIGNEMTAEEVMTQVERDSIFYHSSNGGMTVSGGEPFAQPEFLLELLTSAKAKGIHTAVETCGFASAELMKKAAQYTDLFLYDWKETDPFLHKRYTGRNNRRILANLELLAQINKPVILRCPIIPGYNDRDDHFAGIADLTCRYSNIRGVDMEPYHNLGEAKVSGLGHATANTIVPPTDQVVAQWKSKLETACCCTVKVPSYDLNEEKESYQKKIQNREEKP